VSSAVVVSVRVTPRSSRDAVEGVDEAGELRIRVIAAPTDGAANKAVTRLLAKTLGVPRGAVSVEAGATRRHKRLRVDGVDPSALLERWPGLTLKRR
jgi:uncharacterized protein (TIGR00251 family)